LNTICFGGFAGSGGSALRDVFKEFDKVHLFQNEFRLVKERYGILDLEKAIYEDTSPENIDLAIKDFIWLTKNMDFPYSRFSRIGNHYGNLTNGQFQTLTQKYIQSIVEYQYPMDWHFFQFKRSHFQQIIHRIKKKFKIGDSHQNAFYTSLEQDKFVEITKEYISKTISASSKSEFNAVALHNAIPPYGATVTNKSMKYFDKIKLIIIDRDPRDIFLDLPNGKYLPKSDNIMTRARAFVSFSKRLRSETQLLKTNPHILFLKFEDLILEYESTLNQLQDFLNYDLGSHNKFSCFDPKVSEKNIFKWQSASGDAKKSLEYIASELREYLYTNY
tara:strand:+ start:1711 stop:2706 length:996 start_codon:yes stop_codon:yes gene_type:complete